MRRQTRGKAWDRSKDRQGLSGRPWRRLRQRILERDKYLCQPCAFDGRVTEATAVDHIQALANGGTDDESNLRAICNECHEAKTAKDTGRRLAQKVGIDGYPLRPSRV